MSSPADENTQPVKLKKTRKKQTLNPETDKRFKGNGQRTEAQTAAQFKPGNTESKNSVRANNAKQNREFRIKCRKILNDAALGMLVERLYDEDLDTKQFMEIIKYLTLYGIGKPAEMELEEDDKPDASIINNIVISQEMLNAALINDTEHLVINGSSVSE